MINKTDDKFLDGWLDQETYEKLEKEHLNRSKSDGEKQSSSTILGTILIKPDLTVVDRFMNGFLEGLGVVAAFFILIAVFKITKYLGG